MSEICNPHGRKRCSECAYVREIEEDNEHYKAIAELAVTALTKIQDRYAGEYGGHIAESEMRIVARDALEEIKRMGEGVNK